MLTLTHLYDEGSYSNYMITYKDVNVSALLYSVEPRGTLVIPGCTHLSRFQFVNSFRNYDVNELFEFMAQMAKLFEMDYTIIKGRLEQL